jgi:hypothetical protein
MTEGPFELRGLGQGFEDALDPALRSRSSHHRESVAVAEYS